MTEQLTGEIIWYGSEKKAIIMRLKGNIDETLINLTILPSDDYWGYEVTLTRREIGTLYAGTFKESGGSFYEGNVECEVFKSIEGKEKFVLSGNWYEKESFFWYAKMSFKNFPDE